MVGTLVPLQFGLPGGPELLIILLIAVLLFGANKIPKLARSTGEAMGEFQKGREEVEEELQNMREGATGATDRDRETTTRTTTEPETETETTTTEELNTEDEETERETENT